MKPVKVLEVIRQGEIGGGETHLLDLIAGFDNSMVIPVVMAFTGGHMIDTLERHGVKCYVVETQKAFDLAVQHRIMNIIKEENIQIVHAHGSRAASNLLWPTWKLDLPMVYTVHGWSFHQDQNKLIYKLRAWSEKIICWQSKRVICVSESNHQSGMDSFGLSENYSEVIENGVNLCKFNVNQRKKDIRKELRIPEEEFIIGLIGRVTLQKSPLEFIKAVAIANSKNPKIKGLLVGEGDMRQLVLDYIRRENLCGCFYLSDFRVDIPDVLQCIDVFCLPSLWEGLSIALLEAMAMEKPIVATPTDGTREIIKDHHNGLIVPFNDSEKLAKAFEEYHDNEELRKTCGMNALTLIKERFDNQRISDRVATIYGEIVK